MGHNHFMTMMLLSLMQHIAAMYFDNYAHTSCFSTIFKFKFRHSCVAISHFDILLPYGIMKDDIIYT